MSFESESRLKELSARPSPGQESLWEFDTNGNPIAKVGSEFKHYPFTNEDITEQPHQDSNINSEPETKPSPLITRRNLLKGAGLVALGAGLELILTRKVKLPIPSFESSTDVKPETKFEAGRIILENEETNYQMEMTGKLSYVPDGPITYWTTKEGKRRYLLTGGDMNMSKNWDGNATYMIETDGAMPLKDIMGSGKITPDSFKQVFGPDQNVQYRKHYAGITSVLQTDKSNPDHLLATVHGEERTSRNEHATFRATVGLAESFDGGLTWQDKGPFIQGTDSREPGYINRKGEIRVTGAGQPTSIYNERDEYAYFAWVDWAAEDSHPDQIYLAKAKANDDGSLGQLEYYTNNGFSTEFSASTLKSVIPVPEGSNMIYVALPHITWNTELNQFICIGESDTGFWSTTSTDLVNWTAPELIYDFSEPITVKRTGDEPVMKAGKPHSILKVGEKWDSYPSLLDESQADSQTTGKSGILYHSTGDNINPHEPVAVNFSIQK